MDSITLPYHLICPTIVFVLILTVLLYKRKEIFKAGNWKWFWISFTVFCIVYVFLVGRATYIDVSSQLALQRFDLNGDGFFNGNEITSEQKAAMTKVISDAGRSFIVFTGLIFSAMIAIFVFAIGEITKYFKLKKA